MFSKVFKTSVSSVALVTLLTISISSTLMAEDSSQQLLEAETRLLAELEVEAKEVKEQGNAASNLAKASLKVDSGESDNLKSSTPSQGSEQESISLDDQSSSNPDDQSLALRQENESLEQRLSQQQKTLSGLQSDRQSLRSNLQRTETRVQSLLREIEETRNRLMIAETEVERLSRIIEARNIKNYSASKGSNIEAKLSPSTLSRNLPDTPSQPESDMIIATITVDKANLRTGPGTDNSPLMTVAKGTRLAIETRQGDWYRVISPTGARAWVSSDVVSFGSSIHSSPNKTVRIKGANPDVEEEAFRFIQSHSR